MARRLEEEGFTGLYCPSLGDGLGLCEAIALATREIPFGTSIANIYTRHPYDFAQTAALPPRGVGRPLSLRRRRQPRADARAPRASRPGKPLEDMRRFVRRSQGGRQAGGRAAADHARDAPQEDGRARRRDRPGRRVGQCRALAHAGIARAPARRPRAADPDFFIGNMVPTCIDDDRAAAAAVNRRTLTGYVKLPELPELLDRGRLRGGDAGDPEGHRGGRGDSASRS